MCKTKKVIALLMCAALLVLGSIAGTMAYLTSQTEEVKNTFTVGQVKITLDEAKVNSSGQPLNREDGIYEEDGGTLADRVTANEYHLIPGKTYVKDPTVHFADGSAASWLFVEVKNDISALEPASGSNKTIAEQITGNGWTKLDSAEPVTANATVYYRTAAANDTGVAQDYKVFGTFTVDSSKTNSDLSAITSSNYVTITGYAIQESDSFLFSDGDTAALSAWDAVKAS